MIILHEKLLESESKKQSHSASPSSFFKSKWIEEKEQKKTFDHLYREDICLLYTSPSPRDAHESRMPSSA